MRTVGSIDSRLTTLPRASKVAGGSVASRIRAFQDISDLEHRSPSFKRTPQVLTQAAESGTWAARGRRSDPSFASPAGRVSRDGAEGVRGDGRPPVGNVSYPLHPSMKELSVQEPESHVKLYRELTPRPQPSFGTTRNDFTDLRGRLRSVINEENEEQEVTPEAGDTVAHNVDTGAVACTSTRSEVFEELSNLIDEAIEQQTNTQEVQHATLGSPTRIQRSNTVESAKRTKSQDPDLRRTESVAHRRADSSESRKTSSNSDLASYDTARTVVCPAKQDVTTDQNSEASPERNKFRVTMPPPRRLPGQRSPVKERAAMFEKLVRTAPDPKTFHQPPIELALPRILEQRRQHQRSPVSLGDGDFMTAPHSGPGSRPATVTPFLSERAESSSWPFNRLLANKTPVASTQQSDFNIKGDVGPDKHKQSITRIRGKVQSLLAAANRESGTSTVAVRGRRGTIKSLDALSARNLPPFQRLIQEQAKLSKDVDREAGYKEVVQALVSDGDETRRPSTNVTTTPSTDTKSGSGDQLRMQPQRVSTTEKEAMPSTGSASPLHSHEPFRSQTPVQKDASAPSTPFRGRAKTQSQYDVEQRFTLSRSRSRSRGIRVSVEVRASPERPSDEAVVIVRAKVESMQEGEEEESD